MSKSSPDRHCCPDCGRDIVNRAVDCCLYCGAPIPEELRFSADEIRQNEAAAEEIIRQADERRRRNKNSGGEGSGGPLDSSFGDC